MNMNNTMINLNSSVSNSSYEQVVYPTLPMVDGEFTYSEAGMCGAGIYLTNSQAVAASCFGLSHLPDTFLVNLDRPYVITVDRNEFGAQDCFVTEGLIRSIFCDEDSERLLGQGENSLMSDFDDELTERLASMGFDSVVVEWPESYGEKCTNVVAFGDHQLSLIESSTSR